MAKIPPKAKATTISLIDAITSQQEKRPYLGMSQINHACARYLWYGFRWAYDDTISARTNRIFNRGHLEEPRVVASLRSIGIQVYGEQVEIESCHGHAKGHIDGMALGVIEAPVTPHLLEIKTMKASKWKECAKKGVVLAFPVYHGQLQRYMGKMHLTRALFIATNKDTEEYYIERVTFDPVMNRELEAREEEIIGTDIPPARIGNASWYECKWCSAYNLCHKGEPINQNCRTCSNGVIHPAGEWRCALTDLPLTNKEQLAGCSQYNSLLEK